MPIGVRFSTHGITFTAPACHLYAELIRSKGDTTMTVEQLTQEIIPRGRGTAPDEIKAELMVSPKS